MTVVSESIPPPTIVRTPVEPQVVVVEEPPAPTVVKLGTVVDSSAANVLSYKFTPEQYDAVGDASVSAATYGINGHDDSVAIQTAIDNASANAIAGGKTATVEFQAKGYFCNVILKPGVILKGQGFGTKLLAAPNSNTPVLGSIKDAVLGPNEPVRVQIRDLCVDGNFGNGATGGGIEIVSSNADAFTGAHPTTAPGIWNVNDPAPVINNVIVQRCTGIGVKLGRNMRGAQVDNLFVFQCKNNGIQVSCTDSEWTNVQSGTNAHGIFVDGQDNKFANCKAWYSGVTVGAAASAVGIFGTGWEIVAGHNQLTGCQSQDNDGYGLSIHNCDGVQATGYMAGGDLAGCVYLRSVRGSVVDVEMTGADRGTTPFGVTMDFTNVYDNKIRYRDYYALGRSAGFKILRLLNGATLGRNSFDLPGDGTAFALNFATPLTPSFEFGKTQQMTLTGNLTVNAAPADGVVAPGQEVAFTLTQDGVGGRTVTWDASWGTVPPIDSAPNAVSVFVFKNTSFTAQPTWRYVGSSMDAANVAAQLVSYRRVGTHGTATITPASANSRQLVYQNGLVLENTANSAFALFRLNPADFTVPAGRTLKLKLRMTLVINGTAPGAGSSFTGSLYPATPAAGGAGGPGINVVNGPAPLAQTAAAVTPGATTSQTIESAEINFPAAGDYTLAVGIAAMAANSAATVQMELLARVV